MTPDNPRFTQRTAAPSAVLVDLTAQRDALAWPPYLLCRLEEAYPNGMCLRLHRPLPRGLRVTVRARLARETPLTLHAEVRWVDKEEGCYWAGLRFLNARGYDAICWNQAVSAQA